MELSKGIKHVHHRLYIWLGNDFSKMLVAELYQPQQPEVIKPSSYQTVQQPKGL